MNSNHVYIAAPMNINSGNFQEISLAKEKIESLGFKAITAHDLLESVDKTDFKRKDFMRVRASGLALCNQVVTLANWDTDTDAADEVHISRHIGLEVTSIINFIQKHGGN